jgi:hypothetical protein
MVCVYSVTIGENEINVFAKEKLYFVSVTNNVTKKNFQYSFEVNPINENVTFDWVLQDIVCLFNITEKVNDYFQFKYGYFNLSYRKVHMSEHSFFLQKKKEIKQVVSEEWIDFVHLMHKLTES